MTGDRVVPVVMAVLLLVLPACVSTRRAVAPQPPKSRVAFEVIPSPAVLMLASTSIERTRPVATEELAMPPVPQELVAAAPVHATIAVRITVGSDGRVSGVRPSPAAASQAGPWFDLLLDSIRKVASRWRFRPARERTLSDGPDRDHDGRPDWQNVVTDRTIAVYFDARFTFEVVNGSGRVTLGGAPK